MSYPVGQLVGNFQLSFSALPLTGNQNLESSPETLCENLHPLNEHIPKQKKPESEESFGYYLTGQIEGDGHFSKQNQLVISFNIKDIRLAYYIKSRLGYGNVRKVYGKQAVNYVLSNKTGLLKVIDLINGKIRTDVKQNQITTNINYPITQLSLDTSPLTNNYWLAGFCDADASFQVKIINRQDRSQPEIRLSLQIDAKLRFILDKILNEFGGSIGYRKTQDTYYYNSVSFGVAYKFIYYFRVYHLLSYKFINNIKWCKVYQLIEKKQHLTPEGIKKIKAQKESMRFK